MYLGNLCENNMGLKEYLMLAEVLHQISCNCNTRVLVVQFPLYCETTNNLSRYNNMYHTIQNMALPQWQSTASVAQPTGLYLKEILKYQRPGMGSGGSMPQWRWSSPWWARRRWSSARWAWRQYCWQSWRGRDHNGAGCHVNYHHQNCKIISAWVFWRS
jgi:hypothetical protein